MKPILLFEQWINEESPEWHDSDAPDAEGRDEEIKFVNGLKNRLFNETFD